MGGPANSFIVVLPTSQAPIPKLAAVVSNSLALSPTRGSRPQRSPRIFPSMLVHMWQMTYGLILLAPGCQCRLFGCDHREGAEGAGCARLRSATGSVGTTA